MVGAGRGGDGARGEGSAGSGRGQNASVDEDVTIRSLSPRRSPERKWARP